MSNVYKLTDEELETQLVRQLRFLSTSMDGFDKGDEDEAIRIAVAVRVLAHDTGKSVSLLTHLDKKKGGFLDTSLPRQEGTSYYGLTIQGVLPDGRGKVFPLLNENDAAAKLVPFGEWWAGAAIADFEGNVITRSDLVKIMANKDGGAHVDLNLDAAYAALSRAGSMQTVTLVNGKWERMPGPENATMRQIAHEMMRSLVPTHNQTLVLPRNTIGITSIGFNLKPADKTP
ncbi:MAG TPA: hypothetical protein VF471_06085 [Pseudoxanthomonas sp.]